MRPLRIKLHTPFGATRRGNGITADRWISRFVELGHAVVEDDADLLVALHARHSHSAIVDYRARYPERPVVVALTGTDIYRDVRHDADAQHSLALADRFVVLQPHALGELEPVYRERAHVIYQSAVAPDDPPSRLEDRFQACVVGHLREVKDPFRAAEAVRLLPEGSPVRVVHLGAALDPQIQLRAQSETEDNPRYTWLGELDQAETLRTIAGSHLLVLTSIMEGGANVLTEAIVCGTPSLLTRMGAAFGILGEDYPGLFDVGDTSALARLLERASSDPAFYDSLATRCDSLRPLTDPALERKGWAALLDELL